MFIIFVILIRIMEQLKNVDKSVKNMCLGGSSGSKEKSSFDRENTSRLYTRMPEAPLSEIGQIGVGAHDMNEYKFKETNGIKE